MPWTTDCLCIAIHHLAKGLHAGSQAKQLEARRDLRQGLKLQRPRRNRSRCSKLLHGVAFLCGITTPSLAAQGEQRRFSYFNIERDNSWTAMRRSVASVRDTIISLSGLARIREQPFFNIQSL